MAKECKAFEFGLFRLDTCKRRLSQDGHTVPLHGKVFDTLSILVRNHGRLVTKDELMAALWPDSVVEETNLNHNICILRRALGEKVTRQKYIETVPRQGYRFVSDVKELETSEQPEPSRSGKSFHSDIYQEVVQPAPSGHRLAPDVSSESPRREQKSASPAQLSRFHHPAVITLPLVASLLALIYIEVQRFRQSGRSVSGRTMLVVLPFENLTGNPNDDYIGDGFSQEIISQLGRWNPARLGVIGRTSSRFYRGAQKSIGEIGRELGVDFIVEGSVRRNGNHVRITVLLVRVDDQAHLWVANYDGNMDNILDFQVEITRDIVREISSRIP